ncbi:acyl--CoA ligase [Prochlorococcus sp. AH-716-B04]|nr:acyl--CoA ligase [Prochlorococcus sp. AH-716-B04]
MTINLFKKIIEARQFYKDDNPLLCDGDKTIFLNDLIKKEIDFIKQIPKRSVVAIVGDFNIFSITCVIQLLSNGQIVVPLTSETNSQHSYFLEVSKSDYLIKGNALINIKNKDLQKNNHLEDLKKNGNGGIVFFSTGTTGKPKAILHSLERFLMPFKNRKSEHKSIGFLLFDHIGGFNTLFHLLFNNGTLYKTNSRNVDEVLNIIQKNNLSLLPTTPTFLRILICHKDFPKNIPSCLSTISYGTEIMHDSTLKILSNSLPKIKFKQTYGMSELGILPVRSKSSQSTEITIKKTNAVDWIIDSNSILKIRSDYSMIGYLNAPNPFDKDGWLDTGDVASTTEDSFFRIIGRNKSFINVGGLKVLPSEIETVSNDYKNVLRSKAKGIKNPIIGEYIELTIELSNKCESSFSKKDFKKYLSQNLSQNKIPSSIKIGTIELSHRMKQS